MKPVWLAGAILGGLIPCLVVEAFAQETQILQTSNSPHASLAAYPAAVISVKDPKNGMLFYVESNGRRLVAFNEDGRIVWTLDVLEEAKIKPSRGQPVIRHLRVEGDYLWVTYGKSDTAKVQIKTGKMEHVGADSRAADRKDG